MPNAVFHFIECFCCCFCCYRRLIMVTPAAAVTFSFRLRDAAACRAAAAPRQASAAVDDDVSLLFSASRFLPPSCRIESSRAPRHSGACFSLVCPSCRHVSCQVQCVPAMPMPCHAGSCFLSLLSLDAFQASLSEATSQPTGASHAAMPGQNKASSAPPCLCLLPLPAAAC